MPNRGADRYRREAEPASPTRADVSGMADLIYRERRALLMVEPASNYGALNWTGDHPKYC